MVKNDRIMPQPRRRHARWSLFDVLNTAFMVVLCGVMLYPFLYVMALSFSGVDATLRGQVWLYPVGFSTAAYSSIWREPNFLTSYGNTVFYAVTGTILALAVTLLTAYPLTKANFTARKGLMRFYTVTMFFSGGLVPTYIMIHGMGLIDTRWVIILPSALSVWNVIITRTFIATIPESMGESATIDGASEWRILRSIIIPLSKPIIATLTLYSVVGHWNSFYAPMIYLNDPKLQPVSIVLRRILISSQFSENMMSPDVANRVSELNLKGASIMVTILPIICIYPFIQKYFVKGMLVGSIKG